MPTDDHLACLQYYCHRIAFCPPITSRRYDFRVELRENQNKRNGHLRRKEAGYLDELSPDSRATPEVSAYPVAT